MPGALTEITELATALGTLAPELDRALADRPHQLRHVTDHTWEQLVERHRSGEHTDAFEAAFANGRAFLWADDGLRLRPPRLVEWRGPHRPPGDDVVPADLRIDHVFQVSCKYLSRITQNCGPARLFDRLLVGEDRSSGDWFAETAPAGYQALYDSVRPMVEARLPDAVTDLQRCDRDQMKQALRARRLPDPAHDRWLGLSATVATESAHRWRQQLDSDRKRLRMLWRLCRIGDAPYFVLGSDRTSSLRLRVASAWDWMQDFELVTLRIEAREAGQPEVAWHAEVRERSTARPVDVRGHVEIRWSHGRFSGSPEAKVYLDTPHFEVPGYHPLA
ncbi:MAG: hypothetical protein U5K29_03430 [Acidimicrobiales bacterium]|nr:hypothetical protein [Acidimicrobiales bacterium]